MTDSEIVSNIRDSGYPSTPDLTDGEIENAIDKVKRDLKFDYPLNTFGTFTLHPDQQVYDLFNAVAVPATSQGVFPGGLSVLELVWSPSETSGSLSVFGIAPILQGVTVIPGEIPYYSFSTPGDWMIWDANWAAFINRFGSQGFEHVENRPGSPIRIYPVPSDECTAFVRYKKYRDADTFQTVAEDESSFLMLVEAECCRVIYRKLNMVAGVTIGSLKSDGKPALYWKAEADRLYALGRKTFDDHYYNNGSSVART